MIDHATDPNIIGRTWIGWTPYVWKIIYYIVVQTWIKYFHFKDNIYSDIICKLNHVTYPFGEISYYLLIYLLIFIMYNNVSMKINHGNLANKSIHALVQTNPSMIKDSNLTFKFLEDGKS